MNKYFYYIIHGLVIVLLVLCVRQTLTIKRLNRALTGNQRVISFLDKTFKLNDTMLGSIFIADTTLRNIFDESKPITFKSSKKYTAVIVFGKFSCASCLIEITEALAEKDLRNIEIIGIANGEKVVIQDSINKSGFQWPMYYSVDQDWFTRSNLMFGPYILIIESSSMKIISMFIKVNVPGIEDRTEIMKDFILKYN